MNETQLNERTNFGLVMVGILEGIAHEQSLSYSQRCELTAGNVNISCFRVEWKVENFSVFADYYERNSLSSFSIEKIKPYPSSLKEFLESKNVRVKCSYTFSEESDINLNLVFKITKLSENHYSIII